MDIVPPKVHVPSKIENCGFIFLWHTHTYNLAELFSRYFQIHEEKYLSRKFPHRNVPYGLVIISCFTKYFPGSLLGTCWDFPSLPPWVRRACVTCFGPCSLDRVPNVTSRRKLEEPLCDFPLVHWPAVFEIGLQRADPHLWPAVNIRVSKTQSLVVISY